MLYCYWPEHLIGSEEVEQHGFEMGILLMSTGLESIDKKSMKELKFRCNMLALLHPKDSEFYQRVPIERWAGLRINGKTETRRSWLAKKRKSFMRKFQTQAEDEFSEILKKAEEVA